MKNNVLKIAMVAGLGLTSLTGCMGQMATTGMVSKFNLEIVDNRYAREGMFLLLSPVYGIAGTADLFIFNAVEFWTGKNPITGKSPAVVDTPTKNYIKVNDQLDSSLKSVPLSNNADIKQATMQQIDENTMQMDVSYVDGTKKTLRGEKAADSVAFYVDDQYITTVSNVELETYVKAANI
ncbi:DUF3332 domain-containing protein [Vibrio sp. TRT 17S01]|uniref:DUF3332 domain-containing protein n=1 Tax=Vibrio sp. TRT 17S01 TaxID=3418505 RepID=UPI003CF0BBDD